MMAVSETERGRWLAWDVVTRLVLESESVPEERLENLVPERTDTERGYQVGTGEMKTGEADDGREHAWVDSFGASGHCGKNECRLDGWGRLVEWVRVGKRGSVRRWFEGEEEWEEEREEEREGEEERERQKEREEEEGRGRTRNVVEERKKNDISRVLLEAWQDHWPKLIELVPFARPVMGDAVIWICMLASGPFFFSKL